MAIMKFKREKVPNLMGEAEVRFTEEPKEDQQDAPYPPLQITASKRGVFLSGNSTWIEGMDDLQSFAKAMSDAWRDHVKLKPQIHRAAANEVPE
jgi:hypothetical protein